MLRSLYSGISGLRAHQTMLDVTGNNIANVNTAGFKASSTQFQDTLSQMTQGAAGPQAETGGSNPAQIGLGVRVAGVSTNFAQGSSQSTGRATDMMISGDGFFVTSKGGQQLFTRAGAFSPDAAGQLVSPDGGILQGWTAVNGVVNTGGPVGDLALNANNLVPAVSTERGHRRRQPAERRDGDRWNASSRSTTPPVPSGTSPSTFTRAGNGWNVSGADGDGSTANG